MGVIRSTVLIDSEGVVKKHWPSVKDAGAHPQEVLDVISEA